jgi:asparagine synthase (glutamine-hydrolysing)
MSGIVGLFYQSEQPVNQCDLVRMMTSLAHRGPDGGHTWLKGPVGLGHQMLFTTPESLREELPFVDRSGHLVITADARLDNRNELISILKLNERPSIDISDSQIILAAYEHWGEACPEKLLGAFAFAVWDGRKNQMFCARDHIGVKPFYYYLSDQSFVFASELKAIMALSEIPRQVNEVRVGDYLVHELEDKSSTFYRNVWRLPPAHTLLVQANASRCRSYWALSSDREVTYSSNDEYADALREVFTTAVHRCLRSAYPVGSQHSSSVTCVARNLLSVDDNVKLKTFSASFDEGASSYEIPFINHVLAQNGLTPYFMRGDETGPLTEVDTLLFHSDQPFHSPNIFQSWNLYKFVQSQGVRVLLDGIDGDTTVSHGWSYLTELAATSRWLDFAIEVESAMARNKKVTAQALFNRHVIPVLENRIPTGKWFSLIQDTGEIVKYFELSRWHLLYRYGIRPAILSSVPFVRPKSKYSADPLAKLNLVLNPNFVQRIGLRERMQDLSERRSSVPLTERASHRSGLSAGIVPHLLELIDSLAAPLRLDIRHPFMDKQLIEFCLALPAEQKRNQGWDRLVMRRAMSGILPREVQWRRDKALFSSNTLGGLLKYDRTRLDELLFRPSLAASNYVDIEKVREYYQELVRTQTDPKQQYINMFLVVILELWLARNGFAS